MKRLIITLVLAVCSFQVGFSQKIDQATVNKIRVKLIGAEKLYAQGEYMEALKKIEEIDSLSKGMKSAKIQNLKVKAYLGAKKYEQSKKELDKLYKMNPDDNIIEDIASYESQIDKGIAYNNLSEEEKKKLKENTIELSEYFKILEAFKKSEYYKKASKENN